MKPALVNNRTIFPQAADLQGSYVSLTQDAKTISGYHPHLAEAAQRALAEPGRQRWAASR